MTREWRKWKSYKILDRYVKLFCNIQVGDWLGNSQYETGLHFWFLEFNNDTCILNLIESDVFVELSSFGIKLNFSLSLWYITSAPLLWAAIKRFLEPGIHLIQFTDDGLMTP